MKDYIKIATLRFVCYLKPLKVKKIEKKIVYLENGIKAYYDGSVGDLKHNDMVLVYGNLVVEKINETNKHN